MDYGGAVAVSLVRAGIFIAGNRIFAVVTRLIRLVCVEFYGFVNLYFAVRRFERNENLSALHRWRVCSRRGVGIDTKSICREAVMKLKYLKDVATLAFKPEKCIGCGRCEEVCPHGVFAVTERKARIVDLNACMECGACASNCPADAIEVNAGVGCAAAIVKGWFTGKEPSCDCGGGVDKLVDELAKGKSLDKILRRDTI